MIRYLTAAALSVAMSTACADTSYWIFGDSLSSEYGAWPTVLQEHYGIHVNNVAQAGSMITQSDMPRQVACLNRKVIYWLGSNDAGLGVHKALYQIILRDHMQFLAGRGCIVYMILPVVSTLSEGHEERSKAARSWSRQVAKDFDNVTVLSAPYLTADTIDGVHPTRNRHMIIADWMAEKLLQGESDGFQLGG